MLSDPTETGGLDEWPARRTKPRPRRPLRRTAQGSRERRVAPAPGPRCSTSLSRLSFVADSPEALLVHILW